MSINDSKRIIGSVVYVDSARTNVLLNHDLKSDLYSYSGNLTIVSQVGGYVLFPSGVGEYIVGIITSAYEKEDTDFDRDPKGILTLHLMQPNRTIRTNLLGTLKGNEELGFSFVKGISIYPSLGADALIPNNNQIKSILSYQLSKNNEEDMLVSVGKSPIYQNVNIDLSLQNLFAYCLGIIGNTGSGKSYTVASLIQQCILSLNKQAKELDKEAKPKFIIFDINGEYANAFGVGQYTKEIHKVYLNGKDFKLPLWAFDNHEICKIFRASPQVQAPTLEKLLDRLRKGDNFSSDQYNYYKYAVSYLLALKESPQDKSIRKNLHKFIQGNDKLLEKLGGDDKKNLFSEDDLKFNTENMLHEEDIKIIDKIICGMPLEQHANQKSDLVSDSIDEASEEKYFDIRELDNSVNWQRVFKSNQDDDDSFQSSKNHENTIGLRIRIRKFFTEPRYKVFIPNENDQSNAKKEYGSLVEEIVLSEQSVTVIDCSMLDQEVLPFFCAVMGRVLLSERQTKGEDRHKQPWCLILEEAHNYVRPYRKGERDEIKLCREIFERIAKEGRKFGLSLIIASQRPSEISETILSQCANFIVHRLQNPIDIDFFKKILPSGSKEVLDQVTILKPGETMIMGTSSNVPSKVQVDLPRKKPQGHSPVLSQEWIINR